MDASSIDELPNEDAPSRHDSINQGDPNAADLGQGGGRWGYADGNEGGYAQDAAGVPLPNPPRGAAEGPSDDEEEEEGGAADDAADGLPLFANAQARAVHAEIQAAETRADKLEIELDEFQSRVKVMDEHLRNVRQEVTHTNALLESKDKEIHTEEHLAQLAQRETARYVQEANRLARAIEDAQDRLSAAQGAVFRGNERLDRFKLQMNWNQEELEQWALAAKQKDEDNLALQKYTRADEAKIKDLTLQIEKMNQAVLERKRQLEAEATDTQAKQIELDRSAEEFRSLHAERRRLVQQWQEAIEALRRRDEEINALGERYADARRQKLEKAEAVAQQRERLKMHEGENAEVRGKTQLLERVLAKKRQDALGAQQRLQEFKDELEVLKNELAASAASLMRKRAENSGLAARMEEKKIALEDARRRYQAVKRRLESESGHTDKVEASAKSAEQDLGAKEADLKNQEGALKALKDQMFKESQKLFVLRQEEANAIAEISGAQAASRNLQAKVHQLDGEAMRQQELIYNAEFQIQQMERKVARGLGERSDEEKKQLNARIRGLEGELEAAKERRRQLAQQCRRLGNEVKAAERRRGQARAQKAEADGKITELELENSSAEIGLRAVLAEQEEVMVQNDVMRLEIQRLRGALTAKADAVFGLENRRQQLTMSMEERKHEVAVHRDVQRAQLKAAEEEKHKVALELAARQQQVAKLRAKFEVLTGGGAGGGEGEGQSQAYYVIQAAQRREELQREGDELDAAIRTTERELRALQSTLDHLNDRNAAYRGAFQKADMSSQDADALRALEEKARLAADALFRQKKELQRAQTDWEEDAARLEQVTEQAERLEEQNSHLETARRQVDAEVSAQALTLERAQARLARLREAHRHAAGTTEETLAEKAFRGEALGETAATVLYTLGQLGREFPEIHDVLQMQVQKSGLQIPTHAPQDSQASGGLSRPESARSQASIRS